MAINVYSLIPTMIVKKLTHPLNLSMLQIPFDMNLTNEAKYAIDIKEDIPKF